jgi:hypothetical protein
MHGQPAYHRPPSVRWSLAPSELPLQRAISIGRTAPPFGHSANVCIGMAGRLPVGSTSVKSAWSTDTRAVRHHKARPLVDAVEPSGVAA